MNLDDLTQNWKFTRDDLEINRRGQLSISQKEKLREQAGVEVIQFLAGVIGFIAFFPAIIFTSDILSNRLDSFSTSLLCIPVLFIPFFLGTLAVVLFFSCSLVLLPFLLRPVAHWLVLFPTKSARDLKTATVVTVIGRFWIHEAPNKEARKSNPRLDMIFRRLAINDVVFESPAPEWFWEILENSPDELPPMRVYYAPKSRLIMSFEPVIDRQDDAI